MNGVKIGLPWVAIYWVKALKQDSSRRLSECQHGNAIVLNFASLLLALLWITHLKVLTIVNCPNFFIYNFFRREAHSGWTLGNRLGVRTWMTNLAATALLSWWMGTADKSIHMRTFREVGARWKTGFFCFVLFLIPGDPRLYHLTTLLALLGVYISCSVLLMVKFLCWECWFLKKKKKSSRWEFWG